jgi:hypothetical protein
VLQSLFEQFPTGIIRENISDNREFSVHNREFYLQNLLSRSGRPGEPAHLPRKYVRLDPEQQHTCQCCSGVSIGSQI